MICPGPLKKCVFEPQTKRSAQTVFSVECYLSYRLYFNIDKILSTCSISLFLTLVLEKYKGLGKGKCPQILDSFVKSIGENRGFVT